MKKRTEYEERRRKRCRHFNGLVNENCEAGCCYTDVRTPEGQGYTYPCWGEIPCTQYSPLTDEEWGARDAERERVMDYMFRGISPCCEAEIDTRQVIQTGPYKGHGRRYCSKCRRLIYLV